MPSTEAHPRRLGEMDADWMQRARLPAYRVLHFTRHLAVLFGSGVPLARCLEVLQDQADHPVLAEMTWSIAKDVQSGRRFSAACARFPRIFESTYVAVLKVAEMTGQLHESLVQLADWQERDARQRSQMKAALIYPTFVLGLTLVMSLWMCYFILPSILQGLSSAGPLPWPTALLLAFVALIRRPLGVLLLLGLLGSGVGGGTRLWRDPPPWWRRWLWGRLLRLPLLGSALRDSALVRYCAAAQVLLRGGADLLRTLNIAALSSGNPWLEADVARLLRAVQEAHGLGLAMAQQRWLYGPLLPSLVGACEETGQMNLAYLRTGRFLEDEVAYRFHLLQQALEPILLLILACVVLFFLLAVMLPLYSQIQTL